VLIGPSVDAVLDFGEEIEADLIVVESRGTGQSDASSWAASRRVWSTTPPAWFSG
jgi:hypothetical protein